ncbi:MAG: phosphatase [Spirosomaceae bacterium]|nr:phosphatase [Spirosomataceae bacterium]
MISTASIFTNLGGIFVTSPQQLSKKIKNLKAFVFDWDGVFNDGTKNEQGSSNFSEIDSMGTNLLRFGWWRWQQQMPYTLVISGERNQLSFHLAKREHYHASYFRIKHKIEALEHFMALHGLKAEEVAFFFDDALDLSIAERCGVRIMIRHRGNPLFQQYVINNGLADYITAQQGGDFAVREGCELLLGMAGIYDQTIQERHIYYPQYNDYYTERQAIETQFFTLADGQFERQTNP